MGDFFCVCPGVCLHYSLVNFSKFSIHRKNFSHSHYWGCHSFLQIPTSLVLVQLELQPRPIAVLHVISGNQ